MKINELKKKKTKGKGEILSKFCLSIFQRSRNHVFSLTAYFRDPYRRSNIRKWYSKMIAQIMSLGSRNTARQAKNLGSLENNKSLVAHQGRISQFTSCHTRSCH